MNSEETELDLGKAADAVVGVTADDDGDLTDMLGELRVLLPSAQLLSAFLITVPLDRKSVV